MGGLALALGTGLTHVRSAGGAAPVPSFAVDATAFPDAIYDVGYDNTRTITGGTQRASTTGRPPYSVAVTSGALPTGLVATIDMDGKLRVSGVPSGAAGTASFTLTVTDGVGATTTLASSITVPAFPSSLSINFGARTRGGFGGHRCGLAGSATLSISAGNGAGHWAIRGTGADSKLVPAGTYSTGNPPAFAGPYSLTMSDGTNTWPVTVNIVANAMHIAADPGDTSTTFQLRTTIGETGANGKISKGDTIWVRCGKVNPSGTEWGVRPEPTASDYPGTGIITLRGEWADQSVDDEGHLRRRHGTRWGHLQFSSARWASVDRYLPIDIRDIDFEFDSATAPTGRPMVSYSGTLGWGISGYNLGMRATNTCTNPEQINGFQLRGGKSGSAASYVDGLRCSNIAIAVLMAGGAQATGWSEGCEVRNVYMDAGKSDVINITGHPNDGINLGHRNFIVEDVFAHRFNVSAGSHPDIVQHFGIKDGSSYATGTVRRVFAIDDAAQGVFFSDSTTTSRMTGITVEHCIMILGDTFYGVALSRASAPTVRHNTILAKLSAPGGGITPEIRLDSGEDGTLSRNVSPNFNVGSQGGTVTQTYSETIGLLLATYQAAMPNYAEADFVNPTAIKNGVKPLAGGAFLNGDSTYSGAIKPDGSLNDGLV